MTDEQPAGPPPPAPEVRDTQGRLIRTLAQAERDKWAAEQRSLGRPYRDIAADLGVAPSSAHDAVRRAFKDIAEPAAGPARAAELAVLEAARDAALAVLARNHITVSNGKVITLKDAETGREVPVPDDGPILQAVQSIARISGTIHDLMGWKAAAKVELSGEVRYEIVGVDTDALS